jgi:hypothetical protein
MVDTPPETLFRVPLNMVRVGICADADGVFGHYKYTNSQIHALNIGN